MRVKTVLVAMGALMLVFAMPAMAAFTITPLIIEGDEVPGVGNVTGSFGSVAINNAGMWLVELDTDYPNADEDLVLVRGVQASPALAYARQGEALASPAGATLRSFDSVNLNNVGNASFNFFLEGTSGGGDDSGVFFNKNLVIQESYVSSAPQFPAPTPYIGFFDTKINDANQVLITASIDIPEVGTSVDRALVRVDNPQGAYTETVLVMEGDELVTGRYVTDLGTGPHETAFANNGDVLYAADLDGDSTTNDVIMLNDSLIAQEDDPSPIAGRNWATLTGPELDLNDNGDWVFSGMLDGDTSSNLLICKNGQKFMQEGETLAAIGGVETFTSFGSGPILLDDAGNVLWYGDWTGDTDYDTGLFWNEELLVQEGVTQVEVEPGVFLTVDTLNGFAEAYSFSQNGDWVIFRAVLEGGIDGAFMVAVPEPSSLLMLLGGAALVLRRRR